MCNNNGFFGGNCSCIWWIPVSYTHLDVYKRQPYTGIRNDIVKFVLNPDLDRIHRKICLFVHRKHLRRSYLPRRNDYE